MFCFHKYDKLVENTQYCTKCGKARRLPCQHKWKRTEDFKISDKYTDITDRIKILYTCEYCGEIKLETINTY